MVMPARLDAGLDALLVRLIHQVDLVEQDDVRKGDLLHRLHGAHQCSTVHKPDLSHALLHAALVCNPGGPAAALLCA